MPVTFTDACPGSKRKYLSDEVLKEIVSLYSRYEDSSIAKIFPSTAFGYRRITETLKLAFYPHDTERLANLQADKAWMKLDGSSVSYPSTGELH
jgi:type I restriction enzyme M protein